MALAQGTMMPFLYPSLSRPSRGTLRLMRDLPRSVNRSRSSQIPRSYRKPLSPIHTSCRHLRPAVSEDDLPPLPNVSSARSLNPLPDDYSSSVFADTATLTLTAGSGGNGCVSFLREKFISAGPANGGDGGTGGNVYIQAVPELKSLLKVSRRREVRAGNGKNGQGKSRGGQRGDDVVLEVPVGTVIREISRWDPVEEAERQYEDEEARLAYARYEVKQEEKRRKYAERAARAEGDENGTSALGAPERARGRDADSTDGHRRQTRRSHWGDEEAEDYHNHCRKADRPDVTQEGFGADAEHELDENGDIVFRRPEFDGDQRGRWRRDRWLLQPSSLPSDYATTNFPALPRPRRSNVAAMAPPAPITLDLSEPTKTPILLAAGATGGLGNPHFVTKTIPRPKFATKGNVGMKINIQLELKLLADLGFVGLPNAGKSTLLRALSNSRARVGSWAFTTLVPNLGTVVLDDNKGRAKFEARDSDGKRLSGITIADIPGLIAGASMDRGLGLDFLRHVERAKVLAFVVDLSAGDAVEALEGLWRELDAYEKLRERDSHERSQGVVNWGALGVPMESADRGDAALATSDEPVMWRAGSHGENSSRPAVSLPSISEKPWFVVATKADLHDTQDNFARLQEHLEALSAGQRDHPAGPGPARRHRWKTADFKAIPVSAIHGHGIEKIIQCTTELLAR